MADQTRGSGGASNRVPELDLLRFIAALSVVIYHYTYRAPLPGRDDSFAFGDLQLGTRYGYLGVTLFFLISGFVILWSSQQRSASEFVVSRISRLYPSFWTSVAITSLVVVLSPAGELISSRTVALNLTMVPGVLGTPYIDGVYWTLFVELKFYALVFLMLLTGTMHRVERWLAVWLAVSVAAAVGIAPKWLGAAALYPYGPYFISGCFFFLIRSRGPSPFRIGGVAVSALLGCLYAIVQQPNFMHDTDRVTSVVVVAAVVSFHLVFLAIALAPRILPDSRWWYVLGSLTYPLYLLHNRIGKIIWANRPAAQSEWFSLAIELAVAFSLASVIAAIVERRLCGQFNRYLLGVTARLRVAGRSRAASRTIVATAPQVAPQGEVGDRV
jgi:peptidoglycan/LPS O-acetylase OafA/YrhL